MYGNIGNQHPNNELQQLTTGLYWDRMEAAFKILRFMGYIPFKINKVTERVDPSLEAWLWTGIVYVVQVTIIMIANNSRLDMKYWNSYDSSLESLTRIVFASISVFSFVGWWESYKIINYINDWNIFIDNLNKVAITPINCFDKKKFEIVLIGILALVFTTVILDEVTLLDSFNPFLTISIIISTIVPVILLTFWVANCFFIIQIARRFRCNLITVLLTKCDPELLNTYRLLWLQLRQKAIDLPELFQVSFGLLLATILLTQVLTTYSLMTAIIYIKDYSRIIGLLVPIAWNVVIFISICEMSFLVSCEIGHRMISVILFLPVHKYPNLSEETDLLLDTIEGNSTDFILNGCITVNRNLLIKMTSLVVTYNIVLLQFDSTNK